MNAHDQQRFDAIRHRLERVTPGPWTVMHDVAIVSMDGTPEESIIAFMTRGGANVEFFAHSLEDIVWLTERVRDLEQALEHKRCGLRT